MRYAPEIVNVSPDAIEVDNVLTLENIRPNDVVGITEIAHLLGTANVTIRKYRSNPLLHFPEPLWIVSGNPAWPWHMIERWTRMYHPEWLAEKP